MVLMTTITKPQITLDVNLIRNSSDARKGKKMIVGVYLDLSDLYHRINRKHGRKLDFTATLEKLKELYPADSHIFRAYGIQRGNEAAGFIACLDRLGYDHRFKRPEIIRCGGLDIKRSSWELGIGLEVIIDNADVVILGTGNNVMIDLVRYLVDRDKQCILFGTGFGNDIQAICTDLVEVTEDILE